MPMSSSYDDDIKLSLEEDIGIGQVQVEQPDKYFELIDQFFPTSMNRIDWSQVSQYDMIEFELGDGLDKILSFISKHIEMPLDEDVVVIGDDLIDNAYRLKSSIFFENALEFFSIPQHTYVLFPSSKKCLNLTFEGDLYFGPV